MSAFLAMLKPGQIRPPNRLDRNDWGAQAAQFERMAARLNANPSPMNFSSALRAVRDFLADKPDIYVVNEGAITARLRVVTLSTCTSPANVSIVELGA